MQSTPSAAAQVIISIIPIVGIVMGSVVIFFYLRWDYKKKILMIEKNLLKRNEFDFKFFSLFTGLILSGIGLCLTVFFSVKDGLSYGVLSGLIPLSIGMSMLIFYIIQEKTIKKNV